MSRKQQWQLDTHKFLQAAYPQKTQYSLEPPVLRRSQSDSKLAETHHALNTLQRNEVRQMQVTREDHTLCTVIIVACFIILFIFSVDTRNSIEKEKHRLEVQAAHCHQAYSENQCHDPVEAMRETCKQYQICYSTPTPQKIKVSQVVSSLVGESVRTLTSSAGLLGTIFILCLVGIVLWFVWKSSRAVMVVNKK